MHHVDVPKGHQIKLQSKTATDVSYQLGEESEMRLLNSSRDILPRTTKAVSLKDMEVVSFGKHISAQVSEREKRTI